MMLMFFADERKLEITIKVNNLPNLSVISTAMLIRGLANRAKRRAH